MSYDVITAIRCIVKLQSNRCCTTRVNNEAFIHSYQIPTSNIPQALFKTEIVPIGTCSQKLHLGGCDRSTSKGAVDNSFPRSRCVKTAQKLQTL